MLHADGSAEVRDNDRGIPVDTERRTRLSGVELVMTRLHAAASSAGLLHGLRRPARRRRVVVSALSARLYIEVDRDGQTWATSFRRGVAGEFSGEGPGADFTRKSGLRQIAKVPKSSTGTRVRFWPDRQVFLKDAAFSYDSLSGRARQTAYLVPGLAIEVRDETADDAGVRPSTASPAVSATSASTWPASEKITEVIRLTGDGTFTRTCRCSTTGAT